MIDELFDNTLKIKQLANSKEVNDRIIANCLPGKQKYRFNIGDIITASSLSPIRGTYIIKDRYIQNGYCYYIMTKGSTIFRDKDIV